MTPSVHRLDLATVNLQGKFNPPSFVDTRIHVYAYLVMTPGQIILIDTGVGEGNAYIDRVFEPQRASVAAELGRYGVATNDVSIVINSHLHFDHCGNNRVFSNATIYVQAQELEIARTTAYTVQNWFDYGGARLVPVAGDLEVRPGIKLLATPGHTPGHQSVLIESAEGNVLVAAQAAFTVEEFQRGGDPIEQAHEGMADQYLDSISKLKSVAAGRLYFSHDASR